MKRPTITNLTHTIFPLVLAVALTACATTPGTNSLPETTVNAATTSQTLVLTLRGTPAKTTVGAIDVTIEIPEGVSVHAQKNGLIESDVISTPPASTRPFSTGKFSNKTLRVALISTTGLSSGEVMLIKLNVTGGHVPRAESFRVTSSQVVDLNGINVTGTSFDFAVR